MVERQFYVETLVKQNDVNMTEKGAPQKNSIQNNQNGPFVFSLKLTR